MPTYTINPPELQEIDIDEPISEAMMEVINPGPPEYFELRPSRTEEGFKLFIKSEILEKFDLSQASPSLKERYLNNTASSSDYIIYSPLRDGQGSALKVYKSNSDAFRINSNVLCDSSYGFFYNKDIINLFFLMSKGIGAGLEISIEGLFIDEEINKICRVINTSLVDIHKKYMKTIRLRYRVLLEEIL